MGKFSLVIFTMFVGMVASFGLGASPAYANTSIGEEGASISCNGSESDLANGSTSVTSGNSTIYIGYNQASGNNQNPIIARYDSGTRVWCRDDYETNGDDGRGYGIYWDGTTLYGAFTATGTQGDSTSDYRRFTANGWLTSYGQGGGPRVAVILRIDPSNGEPTGGTFLTARLSNGNSNSLSITGLSLLDNGNLIVNANSWFSPRNIDKSPMQCSGSSPFSYTIEFNPGLSQAIGAEAQGCTDNSPTPGGGGETPTPTPEPSDPVTVNTPGEGAEINNTGTWGGFQWAYNGDYSWYGLYLVRPNTTPYYQWHEASAVCSGNSCSLDLHLQLVVNGAYTWYIAGYSAESGIGPWAGPVNFTVNMAQPGDIQNLVVQVDNNVPTITWDHQAGAGYYQVWFGTADYQTTTIFNWFKASPDLCDANTCTMTLDNAVADGDYEAWVRTWGPGGYGTGGANGWFNTAISVGG